MCIFVCFWLKWSLMLLNLLHLYNLVTLAYTYLSTSIKTYLFYLFMSWFSNFKMHHTRPHLDWDLNLLVKPEHTLLPWPTTYCLHHLQIIISSNVSSNSTLTTSRHEQKLLAWQKTIQLKDLALLNQLNNSLWNLRQMFLNDQSLACFETTNQIITNTSDICMLILERQISQ